MFCIVLMAGDSERGEKEGEEEEEEEEEGKGGK
jgi:hypothetical protein